MVAVGLRPATRADREWCYDLHRAAMREYVAAVWGWDEAEQLAYHERGFEPGNTRIITVDGQDVGVLIVDERPDETYLGRIEIHPGFQGRGVGSHLIGRLLAEGRPVLLDVLTVNVRAQALYRRLGFREVSRHGPGNIKIRMRATGSRAADNAETGEGR